jgi:hypothetical protein
VSLGVLGLIAGLTIPSIVVSVEKAKTKALFKESLQAISQIVQGGVLNGDFDNMNVNGSELYDPNSPLVQYFMTKFNGKNCPTGTVTPPCDISLENLPVTDNRSNHSGRWILNSGVQLFIHSSWNKQSQSFINFYIDTKPNGTNSKFGAGGDQLWLLCNIGTAPLPLDVGFGVTFPFPIKSGQCASTNYNNNAQLFDSLSN